MFPFIKYPLHRQKSQNRSFFMLISSIPIVLVSKLHFHLPPSLTSYLFLGTGKDRTGFEKLPDSDPTAAVIAAARKSRQHKNLVALKIGRVGRGLFWNIKIYRELL